MSLKVAKFLNDAAALEKTLRFFHAVSQIFEVVSTTTTAAVAFTKAKNHIAVSRRFFRLHKWIDCWTVAQAQASTDQDDIRKILSVAKWSLLGMYFFLEMTTITNVMGITAYDWADTAQLEALKFWFYAIAVSIVLTLYGIVFATSRRSKKGTSSNKRSKDKMRIRQPGLYLDLVVDVLDLVIPGSAVGFIALDKVTVGIAMAVSSLIAGKRMWDRVQAQ
ncbi:hypothetical protein MBLNU457_6700t1 [Dothideomycetes sp. NU457]